VRLFESGNVFELADGKSKESRQLCLGATGSAVVPGVHQGTRPFSFFDLKGDVETLLRQFQIDSLAFNIQTSDYYHPSRSARALLNGTPVAQFGQLHPDIAALRKLKQEVFIAEVDLEQLYQRSLRQVRYQALPRYPAVERDFSFVFPDSVVFEKIEQAILAVGLSELRSFDPVEIFRGGSVAAGSYSILLRATLQSAERTLREDEVAQWSEKIIHRLKALGGTQRA